jgi:CheY-like chemotaxis protein
VPIIFLTERRERIDRLVGLELGAVDYVTKPFDIQELRLRVRNILRRVSMDQVSHPVTGLPFSALVDEKLGELLKEKRWTVLAVGLDGLAEFGEAYGFVARDDVVRAVALMIQRVAEEVSGKRPFVGHLDDSSFFLTLAPKSASGVQKQLGSRLDEAMAFFYPRADLDANQDRDGHELPQLTIRMGTIAGDADSYAKVAELKAAIQESLAPS